MEIQTRIEHLGHQGDGVCDLNGETIYVPFALPGELVSLEIDQGEVIKTRILEPVDIRIKPACRHFKTCGGCTLQHVADDYLANWKLEQVKSVLAYEGIETTFLSVITSPAQSRRRATFTGRRTKKGAMVGFFARGSDTLIEISECVLVEPALMAGFDGIKELIMLGASRKTPLRIGTTQSASGLDLDISDGKDLSVEQRAQVGGIADKHGFARISWNDEVVVQAAPPYQRFGSANVIPPADSFLQATEHGENALAKAALNVIGDAKRVVDLFAGCGTFALRAAKVAQTHAVEGNADMTAALDAGWRGAVGLKTLSVETRDLFERPLLPDELNKFDAVIIDPPRAGASVQVREIVQSNVSRVAFVSCNPATFTRDASILCESGFTLDWIQVVDQFRWSAHVELVAQFTRL